MLPGNGCAGIGAVTIGVLIPMRSRYRQAYLYGTFYKTFAFASAFLPAGVRWTQSRVRGSTASVVAVDFFLIGSLLGLVEDAISTLLAARRITMQPRQRQFLPQA